VAHREPERKGRLRPDLTAIAAMTTWPADASTNITHEIGHHRFEHSVENVIVGEDRKRR
jgi:hypothetical protein